MPLPRVFPTALRPRSLAFSVVLWMFGFFTTMLLVGLWGRSIATDEVTLEASARAVLESELVNERVEDWLADAVAAATAAAPEDVAVSIDRIVTSPEVDRVLDDLVDQTIAAALAPAGTATTIDITGSIGDAVPVIVDSLRHQGIEADADSVRAAVLTAPSLVLGNDDQRLVADAVRGAEGFLTRVFLVGLAGMALNGAAAIAMSRDRTRQLRELAVKIALSATSFALLLRIGGWAVDPNGGRSSVAGSGAILLRSNGHVLAYVALAAVVLAGVPSMMLIRKRSRLLRAPVHPPGWPETTGEVPVLRTTGV